jgi:F0F1-type ATP synthase beta subunit
MNSKMETKDINAIAKKVSTILLKQNNRNEVIDVEGMSLSLSSNEKRTLAQALQNKKLYKDYKVNGTFKVEKTWTNKAGKTTTKEFNGVELEKEGVVKKPLFVREGNVLQVWE